MTCVVEGCDREEKYANLCGMHYKRKWRHGNVHYTERPENPQYKNKCSVEDCENMAHGHGWCRAHYSQMYNYNRLHRVIAAKGEGVFHRAGYRVIWEEGRRVYEHIHLATKALGRRLPFGAVVHHMNNDKTDNHTPLNLVICPDQTYHMLLHYRARMLGYE